MDTYKTFIFKSTYISSAYVLSFKVLNRSFKFLHGIIDFYNPCIMKCSILHYFVLIFLSCIDIHPLYEHSFCMKTPFSNDIDCQINLFLKRYTNLLIRCLADRDCWSWQSESRVNTSNSHTPSILLLQSSVNYVSNQFQGRTAS